MTNNQTQKEIASTRLLSKLALEQVINLKCDELKELEQVRDMLQAEIDAGDESEILMYEEIKEAIKETELVVKNLMIDLM